MPDIDGVGDVSTPTALVDGYGDVAIPGQGGPQGPAGQIISATAVPLDTGQDATVSLGGTPEQRSITFGLPKGPKGDKGDTGDVTVAAQAAQAAAQAAAEQAQTAVAGIDPRIRAVSQGTGPMVIPFFLSRDEALHLAVTTDGADVVDTGVRWRPANDAHGEVFVRDPSALAQADGTFIIAYTRPTSGGGGAFGTTPNFGLVKIDKDWQTFTELPAVPVAPAASGQAWAPQWFVDADGPHILITVCPDTTADGAYREYEMHPTNTAMTAWSTPLLMVGLPRGIDVCIIKDAASTYHAFLANHDTGMVEHWTAPSLTGTYTQATGGSWGHWGYGYEAPTQVLLADGVTWRIYMDSTTGSNTTRYDSIVYTDSQDLVTWTDLRSVTCPMKHIGPVQVLNFGNLRMRLGTQLNMPAAFSPAAAPLWGAPMKPGDVFKELVLTKAGVTSGGWVELTTASVVGFTGIDYASCQAVGSNDIMQMMCTVDAAGLIHALALNAPSTPVPTVNAKFGWRIVGWGPPTAK